MRIDRSRRAIAVVVAAGMVGAFHVGKLPPALPAIRAELGLGLPAAGWLIALTQLAGAICALVGGAIADRIGPRRTMIVGLLGLAAGGAVGLLARDATLLLASRVIESAGLLLTVLPGPALLARLASPARLRLVMGIWSAYMPAGMTLILLAGAFGTERVGWRAVWAACALLALAGALAVARLVPSQPIGLWSSPPLRPVLHSGGAWLLACGFACYAAQWMGMFGFLPTLFREEGLDLGVAGLLTAAGVAVNVIGNVASGWLLGRGASRAGLIATASATMLVCAWVAFGSGACLAVRFCAILAFSAVGGLLPGTLFASVPAYAPSADAVSTTAGLMQQGSSVGQIAAPLLLATVAAATGGWRHAWLVSGAFACGALAVAVAVARRDRRADRPPPSRRPASDPTGRSP